MNITQVVRCLPPSAVIAAILAVVAGSAPAQTGPGARYAHSMAYDSNRGRVVLFGGNSNGQWPSGALGDTWEWDGRAWERRSPTTSPSPEGHGAMCYDSYRNVCVYFGGYNGSVLNETWEWNGGSWSRRTLSASPQGRIVHAMCYDSVRRVVVMFGGDTGAGNLGDLWEYNGISWIQRTTANTPSARSNHSLVYSPDRQRTILFGGNANGPNNETWEYDGTSWTRMTPSVAPSPRWTTSGIYDSRRRVLVVFGGWSGSINLGDTWEWDGANWTSRNVTQSPSPRHHLCGAFDSARGEFVIYGAWDGRNLFADTWAFGGTDWRHLLNYVRSPINGNRYAVTPPMTWSQAESMAVQEGGHLATIRNAQENQWLYQNFGSEVWIGLNDRATEGVWAWTSGESAPFIPWCAGQPDNAGNEDNVKLECGSSSWNDADDNRIVSGVIEIPAGPSISLATLGCPASPGIPPTLAAINNSTPRLGLTMQLRAATSSTTTTGALLQVGLSDTSAFGVPLPYNLTSYGMPGCNLYTVGIAVAGAPIVAGSADWSIPIPSDQSLIGFNLFLQAMLFDPTANAAGIALSNGARAILGL